MSAGDGNKTVYYEVKDVSENTIVVNDTIILQTSGPSVQITYPAPNQTVAGTVNITFTTNTNNSPEISIDGAAWTATGSNTSYLWNTTQWAEGTHTLQVRDSDAAANIGYSERIIVYVDNLAAVGELEAEPTIVKDGDSVELTYYGTETGLTVTVNTTPLSDSTSSISLTDADNNAVYEGNFVVNKTGDGSAVLVANVTDALGNSFYPNVTIILDNTLPNGSIFISNLGAVGFENISEEYTGQRSVMLNLNYSDLVSIDRCRYANEDLDWTAWESCSG